MVATRTQYELRVGTRLSQAAIATFAVPLTPTVVPRNTVHRLRISADRDPTEVLQRLTEHDVQVLEIRRCSEPSREDGGTAATRPAAAQPAAAQPAAAQPTAEPETDEVPATACGVVIPFPSRVDGSAPAAEE